MIFRLDFGDELWSRRIRRIDIQIIFWTTSKSETIIGIIPEIEGNEGSRVTWKNKCYLVKSIGIIRQIKGKSKEKRRNHVCHGWTSYR